MSSGAAKAGNPIVPGWYADPEARRFEGEYWLYPTCSAPYEEQLELYAFHSPNLLDWRREGPILGREQVSWLRQALWAPSPIERDGTYYLIFCANDIQRDGELGGIGIAAAPSPAGPFADLLGRPLIDRFHNGAQPIDPHAFRDDDGTYYLYYGGWGHCNAARLRPDMRGFEPFPDGVTFREVTPEGYVEGPCMIKRGGRYYFMWSEGGWGGPGYSVAYSIAESPVGPFPRMGTILSQDPAVATGAGHHGVLQVPGRDEWYIAYHRRPLGETNPHHRVLCVDRLIFNDDGTIAPVVMTHEGVAAVRP